MDEVLNELKICPDQIIYFGVLSISLLKMPFFLPCHQHNSFSFDQLFLNLTYKIRMNLGGQLDHEVI